VTENFDPLKEIARVRDRITKSIKSATALDTKFPLVDVYATDDAVVVITQPLFQLDLSTLEVAVEDDTLTLRGKTGEIKPGISAEAYSQREIPAGEFERAIRLPYPVKAEDATATYRSGIVTCTMPRKQEQQNGKIISVTPVDD